MVLLHVTAIDSDGEVVLDYHRCPLLPARRDDPGEAGDDVQAAADRAAQRDVHDLVPTDWRLDSLRAVEPPVRRNQVVNISLCRAIPPP